MMTEPHSITPKPGTVRRENDGEPGDLFAVFDYPLLAECMECGGLVREQRMFLAEWEHVPHLRPPAEQ